MKPLKIVHLFDYFMPPMGYQGYYLAKEHQKQGHQVTVITSDRYCPFPNYHQTVEKILGQRIRPQGKHKEDDLTVIRLPIWFEFSHGGFILLKNLRSTLEKIKPDVVFADGVFSPVSLQIALLKPNFKFKLIYDNHASDYNTDFKRSFLSRFYLGFLKTYHASQIKKYADKIVAIGTSEQALASQILSLPKPEIPIIYLGADNHHFTRNLQKRKTIRDQFGFTDKDFVLITAGKVSQHKDIDTIIKAIAKLKSARVHLLIAGSGASGYLFFLMQLSKSLKLDQQIHFLGPYDKNSIVSYYRGADIGIWAGDLTNSIQEGMSVGLPLILSQRVTPTQTSAHLIDENGLTFKRHQVGDLAKVIGKMLRRSTLKTMSQASLKLSRQTFSWGAIAKQFIKQIYEK